ncbi:VanZ like family protein [uncultured archaeon]|nr:VanZ like family protein [uncultured archaeon]
MQKSWYERVISWFENYWFVSLLIVILIASTIFYLSSLPSQAFPPGLGIKTKIYHVGIFFLLSFFMLITFLKGNNKRTIHLISLAILLCVSYAITDEIHQFFVPGRHTALRDVLIDSIGILFAGVLYTIRIKKK